MTFNRILVARASRAFPLVLERLKNGAIHLSGLRILVPHLTPDNHLELLDESTRKSKREIEALVARRFPKPTTDGNNWPHASSPRSIPCRQCNAKPFSCSRKVISVSRRSRRRKA